MKQAADDKADGKSSKAKSPVPHYIEFTLYSSPGKEADK